MNFIYRAKRLKHKKRKGVSPVYAGLISVVLCMVCLAETTWAWFTGNQTVDVAPITAAHWSLDSVNVYQLAPQSDEAAQVEQTEIAENAIDHDYQFTVEANTQYQVTVSVNGNASSGFILISTPGGNYYSTASSTTFVLCLSRGGDVTIEAFWGTDYQDAHPMPEDMNIGDGQVATVETTPVCTCTTKCAEVNAECPVCKDDVAGCSDAENDQAEETGDTEPTTEPTDTARDETEPADTTDPETDPTTEPTDTAGDETEPADTTVPETEPATEPMAIPESTEPAANAASTEPEAASETQDTTEPEEAAPSEQSETDSPTES